jgi:hypothetical protein
MSKTVSTGSPKLTGQTEITKRWYLFFVFLFLYRAAYSIIAQVVVMRLTPISDTKNYQQGIFEQEAGGFWQNLDLFSSGSWSDSQLATGLTAKLGGFFADLFFNSPIMVNIAFQSITFIGLVYLLTSLEGKKRVLMAGVILLPTFSLWTSIASKEAIVAACVAILSGYLIRMYLYGSKVGLLHIVVVSILFIFKAHYLIAYVFVIAGCFITRSIKQKATVALLGGLASLSLLYVVRDRVDDLAMKVQWALQVGGIGRSTRTETFLVDKYDIFFKAPEGIFRTFFGPLITEVFLGPLQMIVFIESTFLLVVLSYLAFRQIRTLPFHSLIIGVFSIFWMLFPNYPFGIYNPGTAIRYRSGWILFLFAIVILMFSRNSYDQWVGRRKGRLSAILPMRGSKIS